MKKFIVGWFLLGVVVLSFLGAILYKNQNNQSATPATTNGPASFEECMMQRGSKLLESFPRVCQSRNGAQFTEDIDLMPTSRPIDKSSVGCKTTGCSNTICIDEDAEDIATTCEFREEYTCYEYMTCERQADGACGWTGTDESDACFAELVIEPTT